MRIESVQRGIANMGTGTSISVTISSVDTSRSIILWTRYQNDGGDSSLARYQYTQVMAKFVSSTQISFSRLYGGTSTEQVIYWEVITFSPTVNIQTIISEFYAGNEYIRNHTISAVDLNKTFVVLQTRPGDNMWSSDLRYSAISARLTSSTNVEVRRYSSYSGVTLQVPYVIWVISYP